MKKGFTLLEVLTALFLLSISLAGIFSAITSNLNSGTFVKNSFIASGLAQEGLEVVRNLRDGDWLSARPFGNFGGPSLASGIYSVQWDTSALIENNVNADTILLLKDDSSGLYSYNSGLPTIFSRSVSITPLGSNEIKVTVDVFWNEKSVLKKLSAESHLFNWY